ncbi:MAG: radical SAM protein [Candidatus Liptonbacteria bacterium]|nr:radical SAM protein [Candidatus Liptonbacteria bacterium]
MKVRRVDSSDTNVSKYVFEFPNAVAEAVLYRYGSYKERTVVCCSTQSGCPVGCRFCGAGDAFVRSLTSEEIVAQTQYLFADRGINPAEVKRMQIMFMSMGEPLLNWKALAGAIEELRRLYPGASLLVSTSAPRVDYGPVRELSRVIPAIGLQFSVHESTDEARNKLIPFKQKLSLAEIAREGVLWHQASGRQPFFNYCAHSQNVSEGDAARLRALFDPDIWQATISVVCERDESVAAANARQRGLATDFRAKLGKLGFITRMFDPAGQDDIGGGCGQLWFVQNWMREHPTLARPSVGNPLPSIHTPR